VLTILAFALAAPAAQAAHQHNVDFDKQEIFQSVPAGGTVIPLTADCLSDYRIVQGSIRVDTVPGGRLTDVLVRTSAPEDDDSWFYEIVNRARSGSQPAQIKLMIACVRAKTTSGSGSQHSVDFADRYDTSLTVAAARALGSQLTMNCWGTGTNQSPGSIPAGFGWVFDPVAGYQQLIGVQPTVAQLSSNPPKYVLSDTQNFYLGGNSAQAGYTLYGTTRCIRHLTGTAFGESRSHQHYLDASVQIVSKRIAKTTSSFDQSISCPSSYWAIAPTWSIPEASNANGLKLVGIGYQGDQDVFRWVNPNEDMGYVSFGVICVGQKTSYTSSPSASAGPGPQRLLMTQRSRVARIGAGKTLTTTARCAGKTDIVTAGGIGGDVSDLDVVTSGGGAKMTRWPFVLRNPTGRAIQVRLYAKCLSPWAEGHTLVVDGVPGEAPDGMTSCRPGQIPIRPSTEGSLTANVRYRCLERLTTQRINHVHRLHVKTVSGSVRGGFVKTFTCPRHHQAITGRVVGAKHAELASSFGFQRTWTFGFAGAARSQVAVTCLKESTTPEVPEPLVQPVVAPS
jgi:hypothetical protein